MIASERDKAGFTGSIRIANEPKPSRCLFINIIFKLDLDSIRAFSIKFKLELVYKIMFELASYWDYKAYQKVAVSKPCPMSSRWSFLPHFHSMMASGRNMVRFTDSIRAANEPSQASACTSLFINIMFEIGLDSIRAFSIMFKPKLVYKIMF